MKKRIIVIGGGIAGLSVAARLASRGNEVSLFEKNSDVGGIVFKFQKDGFIWDIGSTFITDRREFDRLFRDCRRKPKDYYQTVDLDESGQYYYPDGKVLHAYSRVNRLAAEMNKLFGEPEKNVINYLEQAAFLHQNVSDYFFDKPLSSKSVMNKNALNIVGNFSLPLIYESMDKEHRRRFRTQEARLYFNHLAHYTGSNPYKLPAVFSAISCLEHGSKMMSVEGGASGILNALKRLNDETGVKQFLSNPVKKITHKDERVTGVITENGWYEADVVVSALDVNYLYQELLSPTKEIVNRYLSAQKSPSAYVFLWGMNKNFQEIGSRNVFFSDDYQSEMQELWTKRLPPNDPTVYLNVTSKLNPSDAPKGKENWLVMVNVPTKTEHSNWSDVVRRQILSRLEKSLGYSVEKNIEVEKIIDPKYFQSTLNLVNGSIHGAASNSIKGAFKRHPNKSHEYQNLYFVGSSTHPGGGSPFVPKSARIVDNLLKDN